MYGRLRGIPHSSVPFIPEPLTASYDLDKMSFSLRLICTMALLRTGTNVLSSELGGNLSEYGCVAA